MVLKKEKEQLMATAGNTQIDLKSVLHLYLGCDVQYPDTNGKIITAKLTGFSRADGIETTYKRKRDGCVGDYLSWEPNGNHNCDALHIKPILRPLSSMTKEEVADLLGIDGFIKQGNFCSPFFQITYETLTHEERYQHQYIHQLSAAQFAYLLKQGFDLFNLISSGQAVEAKEAVKK
jgi:hypothetical protein